LRENPHPTFADWHKYRSKVAWSVLIAPVLPKEIAVNKPIQSRYWKLRLTPAFIAITIFVAATGSGGRVAAAKKSAKDDEATRAPRRENPPPPATRRADSPRQQEIRRPPDTASKASGVPRENPVNRNMSVSPAANAKVRSGNSATTFKKGGSNSSSGQLASAGVKKLAESKPVTKDMPPPNLGNRGGDANKDKKDKGDKGVKDFDAKRGPVDRVRSSGLNKGLDSAGKKSTTEKGVPPSTSDGVQKRVSSPLFKGANPKLDGINKKTLPPPLNGNKSSIDDVSKRFEAKKGIQTKSIQKTGPGDIKHPPVNKNGFQQRLKTGELNRLTAGETAKKLKLAEQYRMHQKGDVARQMGFYKPGHHPPIHGVVGPKYKSHCMKYNYWGPAFFAGVCFYPHWSPWVEWSWRHHCRPYWDPRPYWCRPVIYQPSPVWVYWDTPAWTPLPEVASGTWVDLKPVELPPDDSDLQLVAVRFVDPGHPEEKLGPRYRVWFRNNGSQPIAQPFNVIAFASNDERLAADTPQSGVRVTAIEPGDIQSVDIRLPPGVYAMGRDAQGNPAPFHMLQVLVDANQEIAETAKDNNGAMLAPAEVLPVDPAAFELKPKAAKSGEEILLAGEGFGPEPGRILVQINGQEMDGEILGWYDLGVQWTLPKLALAAPVEADVIVIRGDGAASNPVKITVTR
jgi:hypothetical protein